MSKYLLTIACIFLAAYAYCQTKTVDKAIIKMQTEIVFPENPNPGGAGSDGNVMMARPGGMEATTTVYYTPDMTKTESTTDFGNNITIVDRKNKKTTTLIEAMGRKTGFYSTESDEAAMRGRMDSVRAARADSLRKLGIPVGQPSKPEIEYFDETKKIAGYACKKAILKSKGQRGEINETTVWYCPDFKLPEGYSMGGGGGRGMMMMAGMNGLDQIPGFPMEYEFERSNGMKMHAVVTKVQLDAQIDDKIFDIPKGYDIKPMSEMQNGGRMMFRMNN